MMQHAAVESNATAGFADLDEELALDQIDLKGPLPPWLSGSLVRVTPAKFDLEQGNIRHWFDGLAMLHRFGVNDGKVSYANRFIRTRAYERAQNGEPLSQGFATDPCRPIFKRVQTVFSPQFTDNTHLN